MNHVIPNVFLERVFELLAEPVDLTSALLQVLLERAYGAGERGSGIDCSNISEAYCISWE